MDAAADLSNEKHLASPTANQHTGESFSPRPENSVMGTGCLVNETMLVNTKCIVLRGAQSSFRWRAGAGDRGTTTGSDV